MLEGGFPQPVRPSARHQEFQEFLWRTSVKVTVTEPWNHGNWILGIIPKWPHFNEMLYYLH